MICSLSLVAPMSKCLRQVRLLSWQVLTLFCSGKTNHQCAEEQVNADPNHITLQIAPSKITHHFRILDPSLPFEASRSKIMF